MARTRINNAKPNIYSGYNSGSGSIDEKLKADLRKKRKTWKDEETISPFWLNCAGYTLVVLMITAVLVFANLMFRLSYLGYKHKDTIYNYMVTTREEL